MWWHTRRNQIPFKSAGGRQFSRLLAAEVCASAVVMLRTPRSEVVWRVLATHAIHQFPLHFPSCASPCAITFQPESTPPTKHKSVFHITVATKAHTCYFGMCHSVQLSIWRQFPFSQYNSFYWWNKFISGISGCCHAVVEDFAPLGPWRTELIYCPEMSVSWLPTNAV